MRLSVILSMLCLVFLISCSQSDLWKELTKNPDLTPPVVSSVSPNDGETGVAVSGMSIKVQFSEQMNSSSVNKDTFYVVDSLGQKVNCAVTDFSNSTVFQAVPVSSLSLGSVYTVFISKDVCDAAGNKMKDDYTFSFTTAATPPASDETDPVITVTSGGSALTNGRTITPTSSITIEIIEENYDYCDFVTNTTIFNSNNYLVSKNYDNVTHKQTIVITPDSLLKSGNNLIFCVRAVDLSGNEMIISITLNITAPKTKQKAIYVSTGGDDINNTGSDVNHPVKTITEGLKCLDSGSAGECFLYIETGIYSESVTVKDFINGITIYGGCTNSFADTESFSSKSSISSTGSGISIDNCSNVKLSGLSIVTHETPLEPKPVYSNITVVTTQKFEINCCDLQGTIASGSEYKDATSLLINSAANVKITNCKVRTNYERTKSYSVSGKFKGIEIKGNSSGSEVCIINTQVATGNADYASGTSVYCLYYDGASNNDKVYLVNNTFDLRGGSIMQCVFFENSVGGEYYYDSNFALGRFNTSLEYVVHLSDPNMKFKSFYGNIALTNFSNHNNSTTINNPACAFHNDSGNDYENDFIQYSAFDYCPKSTLGHSINEGFTNCIDGKPYQNMFPKNTSNDYCDMNGDARSTSGWWEVGAFK